MPARNADGGIEQRECRFGYQNGEQLRLSPFLAGACANPFSPENRN
jgi:hypothetical protein